VVVRDGKPNSDVARVRVRPTLKGRHCINREETPRWAIPGGGAGWDVSEPVVGQRGRLVFGKGTAERP